MLLIESIEFVLVVRLVTLPRKVTFLAWLSGNLLKIGADKFARTIVSLAPDSIVKLDLAICLARCTI